MSSHDSDVPPPPKANRTDVQFLVCKLLGYTDKDEPYKLVVSMLGCAKVPSFRGITREQINGVYQDTR